MYFSGATVIWKEGNNSVRKKPYIALKLRSSGKATHSTNVVENGVLHAYKQSKSILEVNLYTEGYVFSVGKNTIPICENTAVSDLEDFCNFVESEMITALCDDENITILQMGDVTDVTALLDGVDHEYRAMVEFEVHFTQDVTGMYGVSTPISYPEGEDNDTDGDESEDSVPTLPGEGDKPEIVIPQTFAPTPSGGRTEEQVKSEIGYFVEVVTESEENQ